MMPLNCAFFFIICLSSNYTSAVVMFLWLGGRHHSSHDASRAAAVEKGHLQFLLIAVKAEVTAVVRYYSAFFAGNFYSCTCMGRLRAAVVHTFRALVRACGLSSRILSGAKFIDGVNY